MKSERDVINLQLQDGWLGAFELKDGEGWTWMQSRRKTNEQVEEGRMRDTNIARVLPGGYEVRVSCCSMLQLFARVYS